MKLFSKVAIVGTGLIGGSLALDIKKAGLAKEIVGVSRHKKSVFEAKKLGAIDRGSQDIGILQGADLVILATPVHTIINSAHRISRIITSDCVVTDVGSTKEQIVSGLGKNFPNFVGSHPLAGSEKRGIKNARAGLFEGTLCVLTPVKGTDKEALGKVKKIWQLAGAKVVLISPAEHDKILSFTSHLAHIAAFSLISAVPVQYFKFAATGLKDTTRIAASEAELWADIFLSNQKNIVNAIDSFKNHLLRLRSAIQKKDRRALNAILSESKRKRDSLEDAKR